MLFLKFCFIMTLLEIVDGKCHNFPWSGNFKVAGQSICHRGSIGNSFIKGLIRNSLKSKSEGLDVIAAVKCCTFDEEYLSGDVVVVYANWQKTFSKDQSWSRCPSGYFLQGIYTTVNSDGTTHLHNIEHGRCAKIGIYPPYYRDCYAEDVHFNEAKLYECTKDGYFIAGLYRHKCNAPLCIGKFYCCHMEEELKIHSPEELKTKIMEKNLRKLANLATYMGYMNTFGYSGLFVGEDFYVGKDHTTAGRGFLDKRNCYDINCNFLFRILYGNWSLAVKDIIYGESIHDDLEAEEIHTGEEYNYLDTESTKDIEYSKTIQETITHTASSTWKNSAEMSLSLDFGIKSLGSVSMSFTFRVEYSSSTTNQKQHSNSINFRVATNKVIPPKSYAKYKIMVSKSRTTIPYTAIIVAKFSVAFDGYLSTDDENSNPNYNFHYKYETPKKFWRVSHAFGDHLEPFYEAIKRQYTSSAKPWLWMEMTKNNPPVTRIIDVMSREEQYTFTVSGKLERVWGSKIDVVWEKGRNIRSVPNEVKFENICPDRVFIVDAGPMDTPSIVEYPKVNLTNEDWDEIEQIPITTDGT
ncbi:Biomphalysin 22 [Biomphalaria glabrata]|uniref:Aerolysin-like C-terminal domain-containing protein n=1 Tax=Biomphalaria glabrata TaxID=6526 RepID=A0A2C9L9D7_BIOGL